VGEEAGDKSEEPTPHKLQELRKKGQVAHSKEITTAILLIVAYRTFSGQAEKIWYQLLSFAQDMFRQVGTAKNIDMGSFNGLFSYGIVTILTSILVLLIVIFAVTIVVSMLQTQFLFSGESMKPDLNKINPMSGLKRIFSLKGVVQVLITLVKIILVAWTTWSIIYKYLGTVINSMALEPFSIMIFTGTMVMEIATKVGLLYLAIALFDYFYQRHEFHKNAMMTKQEIKEEYKRLEGDPTVKQAQRQKQREMSQRRQKGSVPGADVVVTNPVHLACAIRYKPEVDKAPLLLAKGQRLFAQEIKKIAEAHYVPIVENEALAWRIHDTTEVGEEVPPELYRAIAEVLAFVYKLGRNKAKSKNKPVVNNQ
jgi:flagellar biosynthetic protein FlhB